MINNDKIKNSINKAIAPIHAFMKIEASSGVLLLVTSVFALILANLGTSESYFSFVNKAVSVSVGSFTINKTLLLLVNDGLMVLFFYLVGLEIKREVLVGELSTPRKAAFSVFAAIGGMLFPALIYTLFNYGTPYSQGWGVPMATDIAFALGVLTLLGKRVPTALKVFLLALAIVDDLGAILVIALFYTQQIHTDYLGVATLILFLLFLFNYAGVRHVVWGISFGLIVWFCFLKSGVHATIAGVLLAFLTPSRAVDESNNLVKSSLLLDDYIHALHPWVAFVIMPIFAFFNAGVSFAGISFGELLNNSVVIGIGLGLLFGNPLGILLMTFLATKLKITEKPASLTWMQIFGVSWLAGIGFTMSLFISSLAFTGQNIEAYSKIGILLGSLVALIIGLSLTYLSLNRKNKA